MEKGYIHSIESMGTLDGPGIRTVVFFQGCPLRCKFCHNIDTNAVNQGKQYNIENLLKKILKNKEYWFENDGGVTFSGGDPLMQPEFLINLCKRLKKKNIHIAIDTCIKTNKEYIKQLLPFVDLWMISLKELNEEKHFELTGSSNIDILENIKFIDKKITEDNLNSKIRIRFLVIPTITDYDDLINDFKDFVSKLKNIECIELLAYGKHGRDKWIEIFGKYELDNIREAQRDDLEKVEKKLKDLNLEIKY